MKLYIREPGTDHLLRLASRAAGHRFAVLSLAQVEFRFAIRKRQRAKDLDGPAADQLLARFERHLETKFVTQAVSSAVLDVAKTLVDRHGLRAYDAIQLAGCVTLKEASNHRDLTFVCADGDLVRAGELEGLPVLDTAGWRL